MAEINPLIGLNLHKESGDNSFMQPRRNLYDNDQRVIDGTPMGTAILLLASAGLLVALKAAGFRFSIGVGR